MKAKLLSQADRTTLIRSVASSIPSYLILSTLLIPNDVTNYIDKSFMKFWRGFPLEKSHYFTPKLWKSICKLKSSGGLGLRLTYDFNKALISKIGWQMINGGDATWKKMLTDKYLRSSSFFATSPKTTDSWIWKRISKQREFHKKSVCFQINNGLIKHNGLVWSLNPHSSLISTQSKICIHSEGLNSLWINYGRAQKIEYNFTTGSITSRFNEGDYKNPSCPNWLP